MKLLVFALGAQLGVNSGLKDLWTIVTAYGNRSIYSLRPNLVDVDDPIRQCLQIGINLFVVKAMNSVA